MAWYLGEWLDTEVVSGVRLGAMFCHSHCGCGDVGRLCSLLDIEPHVHKMNVCTCMCAFVYMYIYMSKGAHVSSVSVGPRPIKIWVPL